MAVPFASFAGRALRRMAKAIEPARSTSARPAQRSQGPVPSSVTGMIDPGFEGASMGRRFNPWVPNNSHINTLLAAGGPRLRARVRQLVANTAHGANASETFTTYATGVGITPSPIVAPPYKARIKQAWTDWTDEADADGLTDFYGLQSMAARALFDAGEVFIRRRDRYTEDGLSVPMQLQLLESEQLDLAYTQALPNGNVIRCGIEFTAYGKRVAYHFFKQHPGDFSTAGQYTADRTVVPAENVLHIYKALRPGQIRGKPWLTAGMVRLYDLDKYNDAELTRKLGAAMFMSFITQDLGEDLSATGLVDDDTEADDTGTAEVTLEPGMAHLLPKGHDVRFSEPADVGPNYEAFVYRNLLELCASMGLPYFAVTGDTSKANYSSLRSALLEVKRRIEQFQNETLNFQLNRRVYQWWLPTAVLAGAVSLPGYAANPIVYSRCKWITPKWDWVDPLKDAQAEKLMVDSGFKPRSQVIEERGEDPEEVDAQIAADHAREAKLGLSFPVGFTKSPDAPAGTDQQPAGADTGGGNSANAA